MSKKILLVDDNQDAIEIMALLLEADGHDVRQALTGEAALDIVQTFTPQLAFIDWRLPGMDGPEVLRRLKLLPALSGTRFLAFSGYGGPEWSRAAVDAGFETLITKPVFPEQLAEYLR